MDSRFSAALSVSVSLHLTFAVAAAAATLQEFAVREPLGIRWSDELIHVDFDVPGEIENLMLTDAHGRPLPCQFTDVKREGGRTSGKVWTVTDLEPDGEVSLQLRAGRAAADTELELREEGDRLVLSNRNIAVALPLGALEGSPTPLAETPAPLLGVRRAGGEWLCTARWVNDGEQLDVIRAETSVLERGPLRVRVAREMTFADGSAYRMTVELAARQEVALVREQTDVVAPAAGWRLSFAGKLDADRVLWHNQWRQTENAASWSRVTTELSFREDRRVCRLRPWSFWWLGDISQWAGFYNRDGDDFAALIMLRPSRWSPTTWDGFDASEVRIMEGPGPRIEAVFALVARPHTHARGQQPLIREWAITAGDTSAHVTEEGTTKLRRQLVKHSEFPLDEVKDFGFDYQPAAGGREHPFLLFSPQDLERTRRQARTVPSVRRAMEDARHYILQACHAERTLRQDGREAFFQRNYIGNYLVEKLPTAYLSSDESVFEELLAAAVLGLKDQMLDIFLREPVRPAIGSYGPWFSERVLRLMLNYDLAAHAHVLSAEEKRQVQNAIIFGQHFLAHPDYWNPPVGLASANPNMTSSIRLPKGLVALFLKGHPQYDAWLEAAENELKHELENWVSPGGAWIENPGYQAASLDGMFLLAEGIRRVEGRNYFAHPSFRELMDYYGFLLTPPDPRFPPGRPEVDPPMTLPSIGNMFSGFITCYNGWMARATAEDDPEYSARQQFYWKRQNHYLGSAGRAKGMTLGLTDPDLPAEPPGELARAFPGFGSIIRSSWTDPRASYIAHRTGPNHHHYHFDHNSIVYHAKGVPLSIDFGNCYAPLHRAESWYHNQMSPGQANSGRGELVEVRSLRGTAGYSYGISPLQSHRDHRHVLMVKSDDPMGANYVVIKDVIEGPVNDDELWWNLWCLSEEPEVDRTGSHPVVHFPGQLGVDMDLYVLSPPRADIEKDHWGWDQHIYVWGNFSEEQHGVRIKTTAKTREFLTVLYPRADGQGQARVISAGDGQAIRIEHMEGTDYVLLSPGEQTAVEADGCTLEGEIALVRRWQDNRLRLAVISGDHAIAAADGWELQSNGQTAIEVTDTALNGEASGAEHAVSIRLKEGITVRQLHINGGQIEPTLRDGRLQFSMPRGDHTFTVTFQ